MREPAVPLPEAVAGPLRPCPFCGGAAMLESDPWQGESVRIACGNGACRVVPKTEYLLVCFADELLAAWNGRPETAPRTPARERAAEQGHRQSRVG